MKEIKYTILHCVCKNFCYSILLRFWFRFRNTATKSRPEEEKISTYLQCCGSGMFIPDPGSWFLPIPDSGSRIPDPNTATKERGEKKFVVIPTFEATNFTKLKII